jgi:hypothetical protein
MNTERLAQIRLDLLELSTTLDIPLTLSQQQQVYSYMSRVDNLCKRVRSCSKIIPCNDCHSCFESSGNLN